MRYRPTEGYYNTVRLYESNKMSQKVLTQKKKHFWWVDILVGILVVLLGISLIFLALVQYLRIT